MEDNFIFQGKAPVAMFVDSWLHGFMVFNLY